MIAARASDGHTARRRQVHSMGPGEGGQRSNIKKQYYTVHWTLLVKLPAPVAVNTRRSGTTSLDS